MTFKFKPRYRGVAFVSMGTGGALAIVAALLGPLVLPLATGAIGVVLGGGYLLSPAWKLAVTVDDDGLAVGAPGKPRFRLAWGDVKKVVASPTTKTCFVDGGSPDKSLIVPGDGAPAPYDIEDKAALFDEIVKRVASDKIEQVETLEAVTKAQRA